MSGWKPTGGVSDHGWLAGVGTDDHHSEAHTVASHSDTTATGAELETLTDGSNADLLHDHDHGGISGLGDDDHTQYPLLAGRAGGQTLIGGTGTTDDLTFQTTSGVGAAGADMHFLVGNAGATEALTILNSGFVGVGTAAPGQQLSVKGNVELPKVSAGSDTYVITDESSTGTGRLVIQSGGGSAGFGGGLVLFSHSHATKPGWVTAGISATAGTAGTATEGRFTVGDQGLAGGLDLFTVLRSGMVGIRTTSPAAQLHVDQSSAAAAIPVLTLDQADVDEDFIKIIGTSDTSADRALVDAADFSTIGALKGYIKIYVQDDQATNPIVDGDYYIPFYAVPTA